MSLQDDDFKIPRLGTDNYHTWAIRTKAALIHKNCWKAIEPGFNDDMTEADRRTDEKALAFLFIVIDDNHLNDVCDCKSAQEAWETLECIHTKFGLLHILQLTRELFNVTLKKNESISEYLGRITQLHQKLKKCGYGMDDKRIALIMLLGLPMEYESLILHLEQREETLNTKDVKSSLLIEEKRQARRRESATAEEEGTKALHTKEEVQKYRTEDVRGKKNTQMNMKRPEYSSNPHGRPFRELQTRKVKCFCCGTYGHIARNCPNAKEEEAPKKSQHKAKVVMNQEKHRSMKMTTTSNQTNHKEIWYLDSGATDHMTCDKDNFITFETSQSTVETANKERLKVEGRGKARITTFKENGGQTIDLHNVLYVPELDGNLLSVGRIEEKGKEVIFSKGRAVITDTDGFQLMIAERINRLYEIRTKRPQSKLCKAEDEVLWHKRLGHLLQKPGTIDDCEICLRGKMKRKKFPKMSTNRATKPLELIHSDVVGPVTPTSKGGSKWFITFIDDHSRFIKVYFMRHKNEALDMFKIYQKEVEKQLDGKIKVLRSDNGREYCNWEFDEYLEQEGIKKQLTVPNSPQQNGIAERANQTLMDMTRCALIQSGIPQAFWADALHTAAYIKNKHPSLTTNNIPPEEVWTGKRAERKHLKVYGCQAWSAIRGQRRTSKLQDKAEECILIGYPEETKGYKIWNPENGRITVSRDIVFRENIFPCKNHNKEPEQTSMKDEVTINFGREEDEEPGEEPLEDGIESAEEEVNEEPREDTPHEGVNKILTITKQDEVDTMQEFSQEDRSPDPKTFEEAIASHDAKRWKEAMEDELQSLEENFTWKLVPRPKEDMVLGSKWVFKKKYNSSGELEKYKARLVARGFEQRWKINYNEVYAPVVKPKSLRLLIAIAVERGWSMKQMDIKTAYLNGHLDETIYMERPKQEKPFKEDLVCLLQRSLYGLKQAGRQWNIRLDGFLKQSGLKQSKADPGIYYHPKGNIILGVYVDDLLVITKDEAIYKKFFKDIDKEFGAKDLGNANDLLSIKIQRTSKGEVQLSQSKYVQEILEKYNMENAKEANSPLPQGIKLKKSKETSQEKIPYRQAMGSLLYLSGSTRPDIAHVTSYLSQFSENPTKEHWNGVKHVCRYLQKTKDTTLSYKPTGKTLEVYSDADWGNDLNDRKSYSGYVTILAGGAISWGSRKQRTTALSTVEAEYLALCEASKEATWLKHLLEELNATEFLGESTIIHTDNQGAISLAQNKITSERNKHIDLKFFYIREQIDDKEIELKYIRSENNPADMLTKNIGPNKINQHRPKLGLN